MVQQKKGLFGGLIDKLAGIEEPPVAAPASPVQTPAVVSTVQVNTPSVDIETLAPGNTSPHGRNSGDGRCSPPFLTAWAGRSR